MNNISMTRGTKCEKFQQLKKKNAQKSTKILRKSVFGAIRGVFFEWQPQNWWKTSYFGPTDMKIKYLRRDFDLPYTRTPLLQEPLYKVSRFSILYPWKKCGLRLRVTQCHSWFLETSSGKQPTLALRSFRRRSSWHNGADANPWHLLKTHLDTVLECDGR